MFQNLFFFQNLAKQAIKKSSDDHPDLGFPVGFSIGENPRAQKFHEDNLLDLNHDVETEQNIADVETKLIPLLNQ